MKKTHVMKGGAGSTLEVELQSKEEGTWKFFVQFIAIGRPNPDQTAAFMLRLREEFLKQHVSPDLDVHRIEGVVLNAMEKHANDLDRLAPNDYVALVEVWIQEALADLQ